MMQAPPSPSDARGSVIAAATLALCALVGVVAIVHHPSVMVRTPREALAGMVRLAPLDRIVHSSLIAMIAALVFALVTFSQRRGMQLASTLGGLVAFSFGSAMLACAGVIDGFVLPDVAQRYAGGSASEADAAIVMLVGCASMIQALSKVGFLATSAGTLIWACGLLRFPPDRVTGLLGIVSGAGAIALVAFGGQLTPHTLLEIIVLQSIWYLAVAAWLLRPSRSVSQVTCAL